MKHGPRGSLVPRRCPWSGSCLVWQDGSVKLCHYFKDESPGFQPSLRYDDITDDLHLQYPDPLFYQGFLKGSLATSTPSYPKRHPHRLNPPPPLSRCRKAILRLPSTRLPVNAPSSSFLFPGRILCLRAGLGAPYRAARAFSRALICSWDGWALRAGSGDV